MKLTVFNSTQREKNGTIKNPMDVFLSTDEHNDALCALMREITMPGTIEMTYTREPNYFYGLQIQGKFNQVGICAVDGKIVGIGCRSVKPMYINSKPMDFGYLNGLRALKIFQGGITMKIFNLLNEVHKDNRVRGYLNTIIDNNYYAEQALSSGRKGMPEYIEFGKYHSYAININSRKKATGPPEDFEILRGDDVTLNEIVKFINREGKKKQFFPVYSVNDFKSNFTRDFSQNDFFVAKQNGAIIGVIGKWYQGKYKQNIITGYNGYLKYLRPFINMILKIAGYKPLTKPGSLLKMCYASFICIKDNNKMVIDYLLDELYQDIKDKGYHYLLAGFHEQDPLKEAVKKYYSVCYKSRLFLVAWEKDREFCRNIDRTMIPYLEVGTL